MLQGDVPQGTESSDNFEEGVRRISDTSTELAAPEKLRSAALEASHQTGRVQTRSLQFIKLTATYL